MYIRRTLFKVLAGVMIASMVLGLLPVRATVFAASPDIVISQVYGGGGNSGAPYTNDFVELFNHSQQAVSLNGWSIQYASAAGTGNFGANSGQLTELGDVSLQPGQYLLVQEAGGANGATLPAPDVVDATPINMSATGGKVALVRSSLSLGCNGGSTPCSARQMGLVADLVGFGNANFYEGSAAAATLSNATAAFRSSGGCGDTDNNAADFTAAAPDPRNTATALNVCAPLPTNPSAAGAVDPASVALGGSALLSVQVTPGSNPLSTSLVVTANLTAIGGADAQPMLDDGTQGDLSAGDNTFSFLAQVGAGTEPGLKSLPFNVLDAQNRTASGLMTLTVESPLDAAPVVASTSPLDGASGVVRNASISLTFSEPVDVSGDWFALTCSQSGSHSAGVSGGPVSFTLDPQADFAYAENCSLTIFGAQVSDQDGNDPPDTMAADSTVAFSVELNVCALAYTPIYTLQGSGLTAAVLGTVTTQGVVVGDYEGASPTLQGYFLQDLSGDGDPATSDGIFVFDKGKDLVKLGDVVRVTGTVSEYQGQTQITQTALSACGSGSVEPVDVTLPFPDANYPERYEGMLVRLPQTLYVSETYQLGRFGEVLMSVDGRLKQPTNVAAPGAEANAVLEENNLKQLLIDDELNNQNRDPILFGRNGDPLSASNTLRGGDTATGMVGILTYTWGGASASPNAYRLRPVNALGGGVPNFVPANPRPVGSPEVGGTLKVAGMNLLNYFNTFGAGCTLGMGGGATDCRGAESALEFTRQATKTAAAIIGTGADIIGVTEVENDGYGPDSAIQDLVSRLNAATAPGTYAFIDVDAGTGQTNALGVDAIKVGFLYKTASVQPVGATRALNTGAFGMYTLSDGSTTQRNRPALAQAFQQVSNGARLTVAVNHLKSKGSGCELNVSPVGPDPDQLDGQGGCNQTRATAAAELAAWLKTDPTGSGSPNVLILGDLNAYAREDPVTAIRQAGFTDLINVFSGSEGYSYVFDGLWGYLDHALGSAALAAQVTGVMEWHINADEPPVLDYNVNYKSAEQILNFYSPDAYRAADHDPVVVGLKLNGPPSANANGPYAVAEGSSVTLNGSGVDPDGDALTYAWDLDNNGSFETPGQSVSFSALQLDAPSTYPVKLQVSDPGGLSYTAETTVSVIFNFSGFFPPIQNLPAFNKAKSGSSIPVKFSLSGNQGMNIFADGYPRSQVVACGTDVQVDGVEGVDASSLKYDRRSDQYAFVWKTDKTWTGCRQLVVSLVDGTTYRANFQFK
jgi:uncharacterized protein